MPNKPKRTSSGAEVRYAYTALATNPHIQGPQQNGCTMGIITAINDEAAKRKAAAVCDSTFPRMEGWRGHFAMVSFIPDPYTPHLPLN